MANQYKGRNSRFHGADQREMQEVQQLFRTGQLESALKKAERLVTRYPRHMFGWNALGAIYLDLNKPGDAERCFRRACELDPASFAVWSNLGATLGAQNKADEAIPLLEKAIAINPRHADSYYHLGNALDSKGLLEPAKRNYQRALELEPRLSNASNNLGIVLIKLGEFAEAAIWLRNALVHNPQFPEACNNLGNALLRLQKHDEAILAYRNAIALRPAYPQAYFNIGNALAALGKLDEATDYYRSAVRLNPNFHEAWSRLGIAMRDQKREQEAFDCYRKAVELDPRYVDAHIGLGNLWLDSGKFESAIQCFRHAISLKPDYADAHMNLGVALYRQGQFNEALTSYMEALRLNPMSCLAHLNVADILLMSECELQVNRAGNEGSMALNALTMYELALQKATPGDAGGGLALLRLAVVHWLKCDLDEAKRYYQRIPEFISSGRTADKAIASYENYFEALLGWYGSLRSAPKLTSSGQPVLHVIGESHALSPHGTEIEIASSTYACRSHWIVGAKQWHFAQGPLNHYKVHFQHVCAKIPEASSVLLLIGEIDCRLDEGIFEAARKGRGTIPELIKTTVEGYLRFVLEMTSARRQSIVIGGIPATNEPAVLELPPQTREEYLAMLDAFNTMLKTMCAERGCGYLDLFALTNRCDGYSNGVWHLDSHHLKPDAYQRAFRHHFTSAC